MTEPVLDARPFERIPAEVAWRLRPYIGKAAEEALGEVLAAGAVEPGTPGENRAREFIARSLEDFYDLIEDPHRARDGIEETYVAIGRLLARSGHDAGSTHRVMRRSARAAWTALVAMAGATDLDRATLALLADAQFGFMDMIAALIARGHAESPPAGTGGHRLLDLLLSDPPAAPKTVAAAAREAGWALPRTVAAAALHRRGADPAAVPALAPDVLADLTAAEPRALVPDPDGPGRGRLLEKLARDWIVAIGPTLPAARAADSLRWARDALDLARRGVLPSEDLVRCADHVPELALFGAEELVGQAARACLAPLRAVPRSQAERLAETLLSLLRNNFNATAVGAELHVHPQTVRQRLRQLEELFGAGLEDPERCLELEMVLHTRLTAGFSRSRP